MVAYFKHGVIESSLCVAEQKLRINQLKEAKKDVMLGANSVVVHHYQLNMRHHHLIHC